MEVQPGSEMLTGSEDLPGILSKRKITFVVVTVRAVIAAIVTASSFVPETKDGLEKEFRAQFWACFAVSGIVAIIVNLMGLKMASRVGVEDD